MKRILFFPVVLLTLTLSSCELLNRLIPDVEKTVSFIYPIVIDSNTPEGFTNKTYVDITSYDEYKDYEQHITGYAIQKVTYTIKEYDAPDDLYFEGKVVAFDDDEKTKVVPGSMPPINLSKAASDGETDLTGDEDAFDQIVTWLEDPGTLNIRFEYSFENEDGTPYNFEETDFGSGFDLKISLHLVFLTGL